MTEIQRRKQRWLDFQDLDSQTNRILVIHCAENLPERPLLWWEKKNERIDWAYETYCRLLENTQSIADSMVPHLSVATGTEIFAEAFGCAVHRPEDNNPFALPLVHTAAEASRLRVPRLEDTRLTELFDMADRLLARADGEAVLGMPDIQSPADIAALIWEKASFFEAMAEQPEAVAELCQKTQQLLCAFLDAWFTRYGRDYVAHYPSYFMRGGLTLSEDEIGAVSPAMYRQFFERELAQLSARYGGIGIHCCADSMHQWDNLARVPGLRMLNLTRPESQTPQAVNRFAKVCAQFPNCHTFDVRLIADPSGTHVGWFPSAATRAEAAELAERFNGDPYMQLH